MKQKFLWLLSGLGILVISIYLEWPDKDLHFYVCDVGQGDGLVITQGFSQVVVDAGPRQEDMLACLDEHLPFWDNQLELVVLTHFDSDHIKGLPRVSDRYQLNEVWISNLHKPKTQAANQVFMALGKEESAKIKIPVFGQQKRFLGGMEVTVKGPISLSESVFEVSHNMLISLSSETILSDKKSEIFLQPIDQNSQSLVLKVVFGKTSLLLTGDLAIPEESALVDRGLIDHVDVLKVGHHGSKFSSGQHFLQAVQPEVAVISLEENNRYHHPAPEVIDRLTAIGAKIYRTDQLGEIQIRSNGQQIWVED